ncbi:MAG: hypothetical protein KFW07_00970, partial [Mycoplasmataceae bacterium]|nr:hypothetical protein [Mycoplasmataceae bacterium]
FNGVTADNFKNFTYEAIATNGAVAGKITLTAKEGFTFGSSNTLVSEVIEILDIEMNTNITQNDINEVIGPLNNGNASDEFKAASLNMALFKGVTADNFKNFTVITSSANGKGSVTLKANEGFIFKGGKKELTPVIPTMITLEGISVRTDFLDSEVINLFIEIKTNKPTWVARSDQDKVDMLSKIYNGITLTNLPLFDVNAYISTNDKGTISLASKNLEMKFDNRQPQLNAGHTGK